MNPPKSLVTAGSVPTEQEQPSAPGAPLDNHPNELRNDAKVIALIGIAHATSHFFHLILAPLFPWLKNYYGFSYGQLGFLMTVFIIVSSVGHALTGCIIYRFGAYPV